MSSGDGDRDGAPVRAGCGDGPVPRWWVYIFCVTVVWSVLNWIV